MLNVPQLRDHHAYVAPNWRRVMTVVDPNFDLGLETSQRFMKSDKMVDTFRYVRRRPETHHKNPTPVNYDYEGTTKADVTRRGSFPRTVFFKVG